MRLGIATKLSLLVVPLVLLPVGGIGYVWYSTTRVALETQFTEELQARLRQVSLRLRPFLHERELDLYDLASSPTLGDYHYQLEYRLLQEAEVALQKLADHLAEFARRRRGDVAQIRYVDQRGIELLRVTPEGARAVREDRSQAPFFREARRLRPGEGPRRSVERSETLGIDVLRLTLPVHDKWEEYRGMVVLDLPVTYFTSTLADALAGRRGTSFIADAQGRILGPAGARDSLAASSGRASISMLALQAGDGGRIMSLPSGGRALLVSTPVGELDWSVGVLAPLEETEARVAALTRFTLRYGLGAALLLVGAVTLVARGASHRVRRLQAATAQLAAGEFGLRLPTESQDELGELGRSFNTMAESLALREAEVRSRTEELERRRQELEVLNTVIAAAHTSLNLTESLEAILDRLLCLFPFSSGAVRLLDEAGEMLVLVAYRGLRPAYSANPIPLRADEGHAGQTLKAGRPLVFDDPADLALYRHRVPDGEPVRGVVFIPIRTKGHPLGAVALIARQRIDLSPDELSLLDSIGLEVGTAIHNARLYAEAERREREATTLFEATGRLAATLDLDEILDAITTSAVHALRCDGAAIYQPSVAGGQLVLVRSHHPGRRAACPTPLELDEPVVGRAFTGRFPIGVPDAGGGPPDALPGDVPAGDRAPLRARLAVPLTVGAEILGVLVCYHFVPHTHTPRETQLALSLAAQGAVAVARAIGHQDMVSARNAAEAAARAKSEFLATMSHEIRTPMNGVIGMTELLLDGRLTAEQREFAEAVRRSGEALLAIINDILDFSKIDAGRLDLDVVEFDPRAIVEEVVELVAEQAHAKDLELACFHSAEVPRLVKGDPGRLRQILTNLVGNGVKFTKGGHVLVWMHLAETSEGSAVLRFEVNDTGIGIPPEAHGRLFQSFSQVDASTTRKYGGTGLGLAISHRLVQLMGGQIDFESAPGVGSTFWFTIRCGGVVIAGNDDTIPPGLGGLRVLVVHGRPTPRALLCDQMRAWGVRSDEADTVETALGAMQTAAGHGESYDVVVVDGRLPEPGGLALARAIAGDAQLRGVRLVLLSTAADRSTPDGHGARPVVAALRKPVRPSHLLAALVSATGSSAPGGARAMDPGAPRTVSGSGDERPLRILVAEDNLINQQVTARMLEKRGCRVDVAANGREAVEALGRLRYDLVLMDCQMPELDGFEATTEIRRVEIATGEHVPIIALTANAMPGDRERCLDAGMDDYLTKPLLPEALSSLLDRLREAPRSFQVPVLPVREFCGAPAVGT